MNDQEQAALKFFGAKIRERRLELSFSQEELAERAGLHRNFVGGMERGERNVSFLVLLRLAIALRLEPPELMRWTTDGKVMF